MDRESQMQIYGDYDDSRTVNIEDLLVVDNRTSTKGTDVIQAACGAPLTQELVSAIAGLDTLGPEDTWIFRHMPAEWFHVEV
jgi:phosphoketolase